MTIVTKGGAQSSGRIVFSPEESPFVDVSARDVWATANPSQLFNSSERFTQISVDGDIEDWAGSNTPASYDPATDSGNWHVVTGLNAGQLAIVNSWSIGQDGVLRADKSIGTTPGSIYWDNQIVASGGVRALNIRSGVTGNTALFIAQLYDDTTGFSRLFSYQNANNPPVDTIQTNTPEGTDVSNTADFQMTATEDELLINIKINTNKISEPVSFNIESRISQSDGILAFSVFGDIVTDAQGVAEIDLQNEYNSLLLDQGMVLFTTVTCDGMIGVQDGASFTPNASITRIVVSRSQIALSSEIGNQDHPVTLRRDMPSEVDATALAAASLNGNSALWVTSTNQLAESNRNDATMYALQTGFLDVGGNPLPTTPADASTIQLRSGSTVRVFSANDYRVVNSPVLESDIVSSGGSSATTTTGPTDAPAIAPLATNQQLVNQAVDSAVATLQNTIFNSGRGFVTFNDGFTIDQTNLATFADKNIIYTAKNDKPLDSDTRPDINLPNDAEIAASGETYPVVFEFTHLGGTLVSTTVNLIRFFLDGTEIGQLQRDNAAVIIKTGVGVDYQINAGVFDPGSTVLPTGVFNLNVDTPISNISTISTELAGVSIIAGDAYLVEIGGTWSGLTIPDNSILVAVVSSPSLANSAANNDWLLLDNPRVNAKSAALLANFDQDGILFSGTRNIQVDPSNVFEFSSSAQGVPQTRDIGTNSQGAGRSITYANVPIQFTDLVGGRLMINLNFNVETVTGFSPAFTSVRLEYPGGIEFSFPVNGTPNNGNFMAAIDIPNVDYTAALNQDCTLTLFFDFFGASFFGDYTVLGVVNTSKGRLHDAISDLIVSESIPLEARLQAQIDGITGELGEDEASFEAIQDRISPYRNNVSLSPDINVRYLDSTGLDNFPAVSAMTAVNPLNTQYTMGNTAVFIAVATGVEQAVVNGGIQTLLTSANAQTDPNLELGESSTFEGRTYFVYRLSNQAVNDVIQTFDLTFVQVVAWQDDINTLDADINRIDAELEHAAINLSDDLIDVLDNSVTVTEETNPAILPTAYNKSFSTNDTQTVFYEANPKTPSGGSRDSDAISASSSKLVVIPKDHVFLDGVILQADTGAITTDLVNFVGGQLIANVFVPAIPPGSKTVAVYPLPSTKAQRDWYSIPLHTPSLQAEADELFFTRDVPIAPTTLAFQYRYDANGGHGATQTINLVISDIAVDASASATLSLPDGESVNVTFDWQAAQRQIRVTGTPFASDPNFFIFDMEVGVTFTETRTTPAVPATTRPVVIGLQRATGQDAVIATKVSSGGNLILVGDVAEVDTNYTMTELFGAGLVGNLTVFTELGTYLNYTQFSPSAQTMVSLENHATLPQFGLFTTEYTHDTVVNFNTQLTVKDDKDNLINVGTELVMEDSNGDKFRVSINTGGTALVFTAV